MDLSIEMPTGESSYLSFELIPYGFLYLKSRMVVAVVNPATGTHTTIAEIDSRLLPQHLKLIKERKDLQNGEKARCESSGTGD